MRSASAVSDQELLSRLKEQPDRAWRDFLETYADGIYAYLKRQGLTEEEAAECFVYVCEKLNENGCRRLQKIRHLDSEGTLIAWLVTALRRLLADWLRSLHGRRRPFRVVSAMSELDQSILRYHFAEHSLPEIQQLLATKHQTRLSFSELLERLNQLLEKLTPNQIWKLAQDSTSTTISLDAAPPEGRPLAVTTSDTRLDPAQQSQADAMARTLQQAIAGLQPRDRLLFRLRFEKGRTYSQIGQIMELSQLEVKKQLRHLLTSIRESLLAQGIDGKEAGELEGWKRFSLQDEAESGGGECE